MQMVVFDDISEIFKFELCNIPSSLFNTNEFPRESKKSLFSDVLWKMQFMKTNTHYVLDDGSLLHRILGRGEKCSNIIQTCITYVHKHYPFATVVFDGYPERQINKDTAHIRRAFES